MPEDTILVMFSGGVDSSGVLHQLFTNPDFAQRPLIVHHIYLQNRENRADAEEKAVISIVAYYRANYPQRDFTFTHSVFNTMGFAPLNAPRFPFDMDVCAFVAANICAARKDIGNVALGRTNTDLESGGKNFKDRMARAQKIFRAVQSMAEGEVPEYIFPVVDLSKQQVWETLPDEVKAATWYCRYPNYQHNGLATPCGKCPTCKDVADFI